MSAGGRRVAIHSPFLAPGSVAAERPQPSDSSCRSRTPMRPTAVSLSRIRCIRQAHRTKRRRSSPEATSPPGPRCKPSGAHRMLHVPHAPPPSTRERRILPRAHDGAARDRPARRARTGTAKAPPRSPLPIHARSSGRPPPPPGHARVPPGHPRAHRSPPGAGRAFAASSHVALLVVKRCSS